MKLPAPLTYAIDLAREAFTYATRSSKVDARIATPNPWHERDAALIGNALTPQRLTQIILERNQGFLQSWVDLADEAREKYPHLHSQLALREQSVVETEFEVVPGKGSNTRGALRAKAAFEEVLQGWRSRQRYGLQGLSTWIAELTEAKYYGRSLHEILWTRDGRLTYPEALEKIDPRRLSLACDREESDPWGLRIWDADVPQSPFGKFYGVALSDLRLDKFLLHQPRVRGSQPTREGLFSVIVWYWLFTMWSWRDVMALAEMLARPPIIGYYAAGGAKADGTITKMNGDRAATKEDVAAARKAINAVSGALRAMIPDTIRLEALKYESPTTEPMQLMISRIIDAYISKAIHGVDSVSDLKPGARAAVEVQERTALTPWRADCRDAGEALSLAAAHFIAANPDYFGEGCPSPLVRFKTDPAKDVVAVLDGVERAQRVGMKVSRKWVHDATGIPQPQAQRDGGDVDTLKPASTTPSQRSAPQQDPPENSPEQP